MARIDLKLARLFPFVLCLATAALTACGSPGANVPSTAANPHVAAGAAFSKRTAIRPQAVAGGSSGFAGVRVSFEHSLICDNGVLIANYAKTYGISTIFVPASGDDLISLLAGNPTTVKNLNAMLAVAKVYLVSGDTTWLANPQTVPPDVQSLTTIAQMYPQIAGILYSVDPEASSSWNTSSRQSVIQSYVTLLQTLLKAPNASSFQQTFVVAHPDFATQKYGNAASSPTLLAQLQSYSAISGFDVITPGKTAGQQTTNLSQIFPAATKPFWIEASASKYGGASYYAVTPSYLQSNLQQLANAASAQNPNVIGVEVNGWNDLYNSLHSVLPQPSVYTGSLAPGVMTPPAGSIYLGAYINPQGTGSTVAGTASFEQSIGRTLAYNMHFYAWKGNFPTSSESDDIAHGRLPVIAWNCGDSDANVAAGKDDAIITARARAIKAFGHPVMVRWFWEMNLDDTNNAPRTQCYDPSTDLAAGYFSPTRYIAAWQHIHSIFARLGVTNVAWLWCVANAHGGPGQYYPGDAVVDWAGMDDYDNNDVSLQQTMYILSNELSQFQEKPFMITETGAHASTQSLFFSGAAQTLQTQFPQVRAIGYLDSQGSFQNWVLTSSGLSAFSTFANDPYLKAMPSGL